jgi:hypothetical protein
MTVLSVSFLPSSNFFLPLRPADLFTPYPRTLPAYVLPLIRGTKFHTHIKHHNAKAPNNSYSFSVSIFDNGRLRKRIATKIQNSFSFFPSWPYVHKLRARLILFIYQSLESWCQFYLHVMLSVLYRRGLAYERDAEIVGSQCVCNSQLHHTFYLPFSCRTPSYPSSQYEVQLNVRPKTCREGTREEQGYSSATSTVDGIGGQGYTLAALPPGESPGI